MLGIDANIVRLVFLLLVLPFNILMVLLYLVLLLILPKEEAAPGTS